MFCNHCGKELTENEKFCPGCGTAVNSGENITSTPESNPVVEAAPVAAAAVAEAVPVQEAAPVEAAPVAEAAAPAKAKGHGKALWLIVAGVVVLALVVVGIVSLLFGGQKTNKFVAYVNDDYELMFLKNTKEKTEAAELSDEASPSSRFKVSPDGKYVYFREFDSPEYADTEESTLMRMEVSKIGDDGAKPEKVDSKVSTFYFLENGDLFYTKVDSDSHKDIYTYDGKDSTRLAKKVDDWEVNEETKYLYYTEENDDEGTVTLCRTPLDGSGSEEKLLKDIDVLWSDYDAEVLIYGELNEPDEDADYFDYTYTVYSCTADDTDETELVDGVKYVEVVDSEDGEACFYYYTADVVNKTLYDYVTDRSASSDADILDAGYPDYPEYPNWSDYEAYNLVGNSGTGYTGYETYSGIQVSFENGFVTFDWDEAADLAISMGEDAWDAAMDEYEKAEDAWDDARNAYYEASNRQSMREWLQEQEHTSTSFIISKYANGESTEIATSVDMGNDFVYDLEAGIFLYQKLETEARKVADLEDLEYSDQLYSLIDEGKDSAWYVNVNGAESEFEFDTEDMDSVYALYTVGEEVVIRLTVMDEEDEILELYSLSKEGLTFQSILSEECYTAWLVEDALYIREDVDDETYDGDLIRYANGKKETMATGVYDYYVLEDSGTVYTLSDYERDSNGAHYELKVKQGDRWVTINDECSGDLAFPDSKQVLYTSEDDLYLWDGKDSRRIAKNVLAFWADSVDYRLY